MSKFLVTHKTGRQRKYCSQIQYFLLILLLPMMIFLLGAGALTTQAHTNSPLYLTQQTSMITHQENNVLGETFKIGSLQYKINNVRTLDNNAFLIVNLSIENQGSSDFEVRSLIGFKLQDQSGKRQEASIGAILAVKDSLDGTIKAGEMITGELGYEISKGAGPFTLNIIPDPFSLRTSIAKVQISL